MKWFAALAALLLAATVEAKVLVTTEHYTDGSDPVASQRQHSRTVYLTLTGLKTLSAKPGTAYDFVPRTALNTLALTTAIHAGVQYDGVIVIDFVGREARTYTGMRADSLTVTAAAPSKPTLLLGGSGQQSTGIGANWLSNGSAATRVCSLGVAANSSPGQYGGLPSAVEVRGRGEHFISPTHVGGVEFGAVPAGGIRKLLVRHQLPNLIQYDGGAVSPRNYAIWADSINYTSASDTGLVWEKLNAHKAGLARVVYAHVLGAGTCADSLGNQLGCEGDPVLLMYALVHFDSLVVAAGGAFLDHSTLPLKMALTIDKAFSRNAVRRAGTGGILPSDTTAFKATLDSLKARKIPVVIGVNLDSVAAYPSEKQWWASYPEARFSPQGWLAISDTTTTPANGNAYWSRPIDPWGRYRERVAYGGESVNTGGSADTTLYALLRSARWHLDSIPEFKGRLSATALPPDDDWTPVNWQSLGPDSLLYAAAKAGYQVIRIDNQAQRADANFARTNPRGYLPGDRRYRTQVGNLDIKLLGHSGHMISGSRLLADFRGDSLAPYEIGYQSPKGRMPIPVRELHRAWSGLFWEVDRDADVMPADHYFNAIDPGTYADYEGVNTPIEDALYGVRHAHVLKFHAQDFSGTPNGPPTRPAWWTIKSIDNAMRAINAAAGYTVIGWAYPEDIDP